jgi:hypothetical protein
MDATRADVKLNPRVIEPLDCRPEGNKCADQSQFIRAMKLGDRLAGIARLNSNGTIVLNGRTAFLGTAAPLHCQRSTAHCLSLIVIGFPLNEGKRRRRFGKSSRSVAGTPKGRWTSEGTRPIGIAGE